MADYLTSKDAERMLSNVNPKQAFKLHMGSEITDLKSLFEALNIMDDTSFKHHVTGSKNDFANWVRDVLDDKDLASALHSTKDRMHMIQLVKKRVQFLDSIKTEQGLSTVFMAYSVLDFIIGLAVGIAAGYLIAKFVVP